MSPVIANITADLTETADRDATAKDWGIGPDDVIDQELRDDLKSIREAEMTAERDSVTLTVY